MPQDVRRHVIEPSSHAGGCESLFDIPDAVAVDVQHVAQVSPALPSPPEMRQQARRNPHLAAPLVRAIPTGNLEVDQTGLEVDLRPAQRQDRFLASAGVDRD